MTAGGRAPTWDNLFAAVRSIYGNDEERQNAMVYEATARDALSEWNDQDAQEREELSEHWQYDAERGVYIVSKGKAGKASRKGKATGKGKSQAHTGKGAGPQRGRCFNCNEVGHFAAACRKKKGRAAVMTLAKVKKKS